MLMEIETIGQIKIKGDAIREKIKSIELSSSNSMRYGSENEYSYKGLKGMLDNLLTDLSTLSTAPDKFVKISSYAERCNIVIYLTIIENYFEDPNKYIDQFEALKILLREYNFRNFLERQIEYKKEVEKIGQIKLQIQKELTEIQKIRGEIDEMNAMIKKDFEAINNQSTEKRLSSLPSKALESDKWEDELEQLTLQNNNELTERLFKLKFQ
jgi:hypothetical protein